MIRPLLISLLFTFYIECAHYIEAITPSGESWCLSIWKDRALGFIPKGTQIKIDRKVLVCMCGKPAVEFYCVNDKIFSACENIECSCEMELAFYTYLAGNYADGDTQSV